MPLDISALDLAPAGGGTRLRLRVRPGARRNAILGTHGGALKLSVTAPPERGRANRAAIELLAGALGIAPAGIALVAGKSSPDKTVVVPLDPREAAARLGAVEVG